MEISAGKTNNGALPLTSINHISVLCRSVEKSLNFYQNVLGFVPVRRPSSLDFEGAWLFNYGIGIHILKSPNPENLPQKREINPKDNHLSFQCESMFLVEKRLKEMAIPYVKCLVEESGILVDQLFFHDPDGFMIEVCNCENIPVIPIGINEPIGRVCKRVSLVKNQQQQQQQQPVNCDFLPKAIHVGDVEPQIHCA